MIVTTCSRCKCEAYTKSLPCTSPSPAAETKNNSSSPETERDPCNPFGQRGNVDGPAVVLKRCVQIKYEQSAAICKCKRRRHLRPIVCGPCFLSADHKNLQGKSHPATVNHHSLQADSAWSELVVDGCWGLFFLGISNHPAQARPVYASMLPGEGVRIYTTGLQAVPGACLVLEDGRKADCETHCTVGLVISFLPKRNFQKHAFLNTRRRRLR